MKTFVIIFLTIIIQNCNTNNFPSEIKRIYLLNKEKSFSEFENWNIYPRGDKGNAYIFDYIFNDEISDRYLVIEDDPIIFKRIFPIQDTIFSLLGTEFLNSQPNKTSISLEIFLNFKSREIDAIFFRQKEELFLLKKDNISLIKSVKPRKNFSESVNFINYKRIDPYWFYLNDE